jgi:ubiquitin-conjugating enzyme (huntingtin interacting protein 2)
MDVKKRIQKEVAEIGRDTTSGVKIVRDELDPSHLIGTIKGPDDTPYANGKFDVDIIIPAEYPFSPPKMKFLTKIWHPNVSSVTGAICLDILKDAWSPALTMKTTMLSLQALMCSAEPDDPQDAQVANMYKSNYEEFCNHAKLWTETHAMKTEEVREREVHPAVAQLIGK